MNPIYLLSFPASLLKYIEVSSGKLAWLLLHVNVAGVFFLPQELIFMQKPRMKVVKTAFLPLFWFFVNMWNTVVYGVIWTTKSRMHPRRIVNACFLRLICVSFSGDQPACAASILLIYSVQRFSFLHLPTDRWATHNREKSKIKNSTKWCTPLRMSFFLCTFAAKTTPEGAE